MPLLLCVEVMDTSKAGWRGSAELFPETNKLWSYTGRRIRYRLESIVMPEADLNNDDPHKALVTYLHERCHIFGGDASAGFSSALTDAMQCLASISDRLLLLRKEWNNTALGNQKSLPVS